MTTNLLVTVIERSDNEVEVDDRTYWCPPGGGYVRLTTILRELEAPRLLVVEADGAVGPRVRWWGDVDAEEIEAQLDEGQTVDWSSVVDTDSGGQSAPLVEAESN